jgi:hypothetical protein
MILDHFKKIFQGLKISLLTNAVAVSFASMAVSNFAQASKAKRQSYLYNIIQVLAGNSPLK